MQYLLCRMLRLKHGRVQSNERGIVGFSRGRDEI